MRFIGLFIGILGLGLTAAGVSWWFIGSLRDRQIISTWIAVPAGALVLGMVLARFGTVLAIPQAARQLLRRPFVMTSIGRASDLAA